MNKYSFVLSFCHSTFSLLLFGSFLTFFVAVLTSFFGRCASLPFLVATLAFLPLCCFLFLFSLLSSRCSCYFFHCLSCYLFSLPFSCSILWSSLFSLLKILVASRSRRYSLYSLLSLFAFSSLFVTILVQKFLSRLKCI